jgi:hypothetical protein
MTPRVHDALLEQRKAFIDKFGREPGPDDPVFFDPDKDVPTPIDPDRLDADLEKALRDSGIDPAKADAIRKTASLGTIAGCLRTGRSREGWSNITGG